MIQPINPNADAQDINNIGLRSRFVGQLCRHDDVPQRCAWPLVRTIAAVSSTVCHVAVPLAAQGRQTHGEIVWPLAAGSL